MTNNEAAAAPHHRRSREEVEALAKNFVATPAQEALPAKSRLPLIAAAGGAVVVLAVLALVAMPGREEPEANRAATEQSRAAAEAEAEAMRQRFEAERERKRKELAASSEYMEKMAAADAALLKDMSSQAEMLSRRAAARPAASAGEGVPTPREAPAKSTPAPATTVASAPQKPAAAPAAAATQEPAKAEPVAAAPAQVAQADKSECSIHVSELSKSGKLTYADVAKMKGARLNEKNGHVFTPPVKASGRNVVFEVFPNGCVEIVRSSLR